MTVLEQGLLACSPHFLSAGWIELRKELTERSETDTPFAPAASKMSKRHREAPTFWQLFVSFQRGVPFIFKLYSPKHTLLAGCKGLVTLGGKFGHISGETAVKYLCVFL